MELPNSQQFFDDKAKELGYRDFEGFVISGHPDTKANYLLQWSKEYANACSLIVAKYALDNNLTLEELIRLMK